MGGPPETEERSTERSFGNYLREYSKISFTDSAIRDKIMLGKEPDRRAGPGKTGITVRNWFFYFIFGCSAEPA